tara:strand:- start:5205 stop:5306 length:102 start_codon:yes stop_codon:yes gene_type:complete
MDKKKVEANDLIVKLIKDVGDLIILWITKKKGD